MWFGSCCRGSDHEFGDTPAAASQPEPEPPMTAVGAAAGSPRADSRPLVAIVGAGLGGLACAAALQRWGARVQVYERDESFGQRKQGYGLTMQQGGAALKALGAEDLGAHCITATLHTSFTSEGREIGRYGHDARPKQLLETAASGAPGAAARDSDKNLSGKKKKRKSARNFIITRQQ